MKVGDPIPDFELPDQDWNAFSSRRLLGKPCVVYFYPKDGTSGCTRQACVFRDLYKQFRDMGVEVVGVSCDPPERHRKFIENHKLPFHLLSDIKGEMRRLFNVPRRLFGLIPARMTFVFNANGRLIHQYGVQTKAERHVQEAMRVLQSLQKKEAA